MLDKPALIRKRTSRYLIVGRTLLHKYIFNCSFRNPLSSSTCKHSEKDPEEEEKKKFRAKCRFRSFFRKISANAQWLLESEEGEYSEEGKTIKMYYASKERCVLTKYDRSVLNTPFEERTPEELEYLFRRIGELKLFHTRPSETQKGLAIRARFMYIAKKGRMILRQGHRAEAMYFLLFGKVNALKRVEDEVSQTCSIQCVRTIGPGEVFGAESILFDGPRAETYETETPCELLILMKEDYEEGLSTEVKYTRDTARNAISRFTYFSELSEHEITEGVLSAKIMKYKDSDIIYGDGIGISTNVYFVLSGKCRLIETMAVSARTNSGKVHYRLHKEKDTSKTPNEQETLIKIYHNNETLEVNQGGSNKIDSQPTNTIFMEICIMNEGACFNLGESFTNRRIIAIDNVICMVLPKRWLLQTNGSYIWNRVRNYLVKEIPSTDRVFEKFVLDNNWREYKRNLLRDILAKKKAVHPTTVHDVPYSIRISEF